MRIETRRRRWLPVVTPLGTVALAVLASAAQGTPARAQHIMAIACAHAESAAGPARQEAPPYAASPALGHIPAQQRYWLDEDGAPLPFRSDDEIEEFLRTADVVEIEPIGIGVTNPERVTLEKDGVRAHAVFRYYDRHWSRVRLRGQGMMVNFRDSFRYEVAAYELAGLLGIDSVPPTVSRRIGNRKGTLQIWLYSALMESERAQHRMSPPDRMDWLRQWHALILFDALIGNTDRNARNILIDGHWKIWWVDHTRAFYRLADYGKLDDILYVERTFWDRLRALDREQLREALGDHLSDYEIEYVLERRERVLAAIEARIAERGADAVLWGATG